MNLHGWLRKNACSVVLVQSNLALQRSNCISWIFERRKAGETYKTCSRDQSLNRQDHYINNTEWNTWTKTWSGAEQKKLTTKFRSQSDLFLHGDCTVDLFGTAAAHRIQSGATHFAMVQSTNSAWARSVAYCKFLNRLIRSVFRLGKLLFKPTY